MHHLLFDGRGADGGCRRGFLFTGTDVEFLAPLVAEVLQFETGFDHTFAQHVDGARVFGVQKGHAGGYGGVEFAFAGLAQVVADGDGYVAKVDVHRAGFDAAVANGAVVADIV